MAIDKIKTYQMVEPGKLIKTEIPKPELKEDEVLVEIKGCGVCHTDLSYYYQGVPTVTKPPLTLGHEISGVIVEGRSDLIGKEVIVPAVMPCNSCTICAQGRENRCLNQKMPGNSLGIYGGYSSHIPVPFRDLCIIENRGDFPIETLAVVADAVTTPYQAAIRGDLKDGDLVIVIGAAGGVGTYMTQMAKAFGAKCVIGFDIAEDKLENMKNYGLDYAINPKGRDIKEIKDIFKTICKERGYPSNYGWKIFECTGTKQGQETALEFLSFIGRLVVVGYGPHKIEYMLSKLMAFDAEIVGTWGCPPKYYKNVLEFVLSGKVQIKPFVEIRPMSQIEEVFDLAHHGKLNKRVVLTPDF
ncbi:MAG: 6-hydroxycyclohex-1-ene-1-carbonyl-CoA dehydrogenase [Calditerrivibrio sp.]|nr:6-hydroxycyclohex-1-ene-1-carbonyl-CoA dehydrogenase [Calditerrivibrio sp.]